VFPSVKRDASTLSTIIINHSIIRRLNYSLIKRIARDRNLFFFWQSELTAITLHGFQPHCILPFELCGNFRHVSWPFKHSTKLLAHKLVLLLRSGLKRSLRSCNDNQLSTFAHDPQFFHCREVKSFLKYNSFDEYLMRVSKTSGETRWRYYVPIFLSMDTCKNFTHNYREYAAVRIHVDMALRFEISMRRVVHTYITFSANGSGRLEWDRSAERRVKAFLIFLEPETRWLG